MFLKTAIDTLARTPERVATHLRDIDVEGYEKRERIFTESHPSSV
jgi:hypothetical protein